jgi:hypothetical protein
VLDELGSAGQSLFGVACQPARLGEHQAKDALPRPSANALLMPGAGGHCGAVADPRRHQSNSRR